ncbi:terminase small subunit [Enterococcus avium]|uniref:Terminase small subunit n=1 Tax=Enterococcus avium TaxID=33945 RepID=A0ABD5F5Q0_ENTAV|nr:terminase small subunit [Enterococcus avium]MDT2484131.1 terminase small subunit [Enterococcus avium]MDT2510679.1 terminase small subunit [Enterococcus avium]MDT2513360.1 terminase small subunit [Enterococcus avium]
MASNELRNQQKDFVKHYLASRKKNATQAAINAGYSEKTAASQASQLLKNPKVLEYLKSEEEALTQALWEEFTFDALEARKVMYDVMKNPFAKDSDKLAAAKDFMDRAGFKPADKIEHSGKNGEPVTFKIEL